MRPNLACLICLFVLTACTEFPALEGTIAPAQANAPYPDLVPLAPLIAQANAGSAAQDSAQNAQAALDPRLAALRARAARLRGPVIPPAQAARMRRGVR